MKKGKEYKRFIFLGLSIMVLGIVFTTTLKASMEQLGNVLVAFGGLLFIVGLSKKKKEEKDSQ